MLQLGLDSGWLVVIRTLLTYQFLTYTTYGCNCHCAVTLTLRMREKVLTTFANIFGRRPIVLQSECVYVDIRR